MEYKVKYDPEADALLLLLRNKGTLDYAEEIGDIIVHYDKNGRILLIEILNAGKIIPKLVEALAKREATIPVKTQ